MKQLKKTKHNNNLGLKELLVEADKITLNDLDFNKILKEQSSILCNIQKMLHYENNINNKEPFKCKLSHLKKDKNVQKLITEYKNKNKNNYVNSKNMKYNVLNTTNKLSKLTLSKKILPKKTCKSNTSKNNKQNNSKYFDISGTIKFKKH